jgi:DNA polymerase III alpha subunit
MSQNEKSFVHLQVHSEYSFLQAPVRIPALLKTKEFYIKIKKVTLFQKKDYIYC